jgi:hypothetical protein
MTYYLGKISKTEYLILKDQNKIKFTIKTKCFQGIKKFFTTNYLNVLNPDNYIYNLETDIQEFVKNELSGLELKSNIIFNQKQFIQFVIHKELNLDSSSIDLNSDLNLDIEVDKIKINEKSKSYQIILKLIKIQNN